MRKLKIQQLKADIACNDVLAPRLAQIVSDVAAQGPPHFSSLVERFRTNPSPDRPPTNAPEQQTYDGMLLSLLLQVWEETKKAGVERDDPKLGQKLQEGLTGHIKRLKEHQVKLKKELEEEEEEQKRRITSDDIHEGWESQVGSQHIMFVRVRCKDCLMMDIQYVPAKPEPPPIKNAIVASTSGTKSTKTTEFEVLNPKGVAAAPTVTSPKSDPDDESEHFGLPELTPALEEFSKIPLRGYEQSWEFIKQHRDVIVPGASDALLVAAFNAQSDGKIQYAKQCVNQSLLLQYCEKLGKDGVSLFFRK